MRHVLVTGGNGFIGGYVVDEVRSRGYEPVVFDRRQARGAGDSADVIVFGDIKDATLVTDAVAHVDGVIHLAGVLGTQETISNPKPAAETNILGGLNVINACKQYDVPLVNIAVGNWWENNTYSITKNTVERMVLMAATYEEARMASVRGLNAYGPRQVPVAPWGPSRVRKIMPSFVCRALSEEPIQIYGDGQQVMDMIYVSDLANVLVTTLEAIDEGWLPSRQLEAGTGVETTVAQIAEEVARQVREKHQLDVRIEYLPMRPGETTHTKVLADTDALGDIGIDPSTFVQLQEGVSRTIKYYVSYLNMLEGVFA